MAARSSNDSAPLLYELVEEAYTFTAAMQRWAAALLADLGLTESMADVVWRLDPADAPVSMQRLASRLDCDPSNVTFLARRLEQRGLIERHTDPSDRRVKLVALTPLGVRLRSQLMSAAATRSPLARLSQEDRRRLRDLLARTRSGDRRSSP